ncbi:hypothetical protein [Phaeobacter gallaeciensis]|uniref:hypothetical protein n=1 Tax=Phaeobacter gallaeciensis TaxID=60890 RepID=UPI0003D6C40D|nr:hypothetical protein [Phaeobacter gallaeciensis]AHD12144.1 hypothetical protein Gal_04440 [Phaeobacter gallaeciensis DSM 26640]ATE95328.1 hypothetical protein PhaeoP11_04344 [Phaeobacter gallaeciensis]
MSLKDIPALSGAIAVRLEQALVSAGLATDDDDTDLAIPVLKDTKAVESELYVRLDMGSVLHGSRQAGTHDLHSFNVRVVHVADTSTDFIRDGSVEIARVSGLVEEALKGWAPLPHSTKIEFLGGFPAGEETPDTQSFVCRFKVHINGV